MSDTSDNSSPDAFTLVIRAAFVPDGAQPPEEFASAIDPIKIPATLDTETGLISCDNAGVNFDGDIRAEWHPDEEQDADGDASPAR